MRIIQTTDLNIDRNGLELVEHLEHGDPISIYYDEIHKYTEGFIRWHWHPQLEFVLAVTPTELHFSDKKLRLEAGDGVFINAGQLHMFSSSHGVSGASFYTLLFSPEYIAPEGSLIHSRYVLPISESSGIPYLLFRRDNMWHSFVLDALQRAVELCRANAAGCELAVRNIISGIWLAMVENLDSVKPESRSQHSRQNQFRVKQMLDFIRHNYSTRISLDDIARAALISKSECLRVFRSCFDMTPVQYLTRYRLELACHQLRTTSLSVKEIAGRCGFDDAGYFGRIFRKYYGITPKDYRRSYDRLGRPLKTGEQDK